MLRTESGGGNQSPTSRHHQTVPRSSTLTLVAVLHALAVAALLSGCVERQADGTSDANEESSASGTGLQDLCVDVGNTRAVVDETALAAGVVVTLTDGDTRGEVTVPFTEPLPDVSQIVMGLVMVRSISLFVTNADSGATADLSGGNLAVSALMNPGDFSFEVDEAGCEVTLRFVNETTRGQSLAPGGEDGALLSVSPSAYVESVPGISVPVTVVSK